MPQDHLLLQDREFRLGEVELPASSFLCAFDHVDPCNARHEMAFRGSLLLPRATHIERAQLAAQGPTTARRPQHSSRIASGSGLARSRVADLRPLLRERHGRWRQPGAFPGASRCFPGTSRSAPAPAQWGMRRLAGAHRGQGHQTRASGTHLGRTHTTLTA